MMEKKVLILSYYWPPAGGGGVQRWLKFTKYLPDLGWKPVVYTPSNGETAAYDESLVAQIHPSVETIKTPIWEPYQFYKKFIGKKKEEKVYSGFITEGKKQSLAQKISIFIRGNFFIPDARCFWIKPSVNYLKEYLRKNHIDAIVSTGPPHSMHRIALGLKKEFPDIPWIADFRDPWTHIDFYDQLQLTPIADYMHKSQEREVLKYADKVVTVSWSWAADFKRLSNREDIVVITNGYDPADFETPIGALDSEFTITHVGSMNEDRNPIVLWEALKKLKERGFAFKVKLIGQVDFAVMAYAERLGLKDRVEHIPFIPHKEAILLLRKSKVLLLPINDTPNQAGVLPGKLYEYIGANRPILCIGRDTGDAGRILKEIPNAEMCGYEEVDKCISILEKFSSLDEQSSNHEFEKYSRKSLAGEYAKLLNSL